MRPTAHRLAAPALAFLVLLSVAVLYIGAPAAYLRFLTAYGILPFRYPFLDLEYISVGAECWRRGIDVYVTNPCDILHRPHGYSPLWLRASFLPTDYAVTVGLGLALEALVILSLYWVIRPVRWPETVAAVLCSLSTMVVFAFERGNVDLLLFLAVVAAAMLATGPLWRRALAYALLLIAGMLKFYPMIALVIVARERPRWLVAFATAAVVAFAAFVVGFRDEIARMGANIPIGSIATDMFGAINLARGMAAIAAPLVSPDPGMLATVQRVVEAVLSVMALAGAVGFVRLPGLQGAFARLDRRAQLVLILGAALIVGCFFAGQSVGYRGIHLLLVVGGLIELRRQAGDAAVRRLVTIVLGVIVVLMWEGLLRNLTGSDNNNVTLPFLMFWFVREVLWWCLVAFLLALLGLFLLDTESAALLRLPRLVAARPTDARAGPSRPHG